MNNLIKSGKIWPYAIGISIISIFGACVATVVVASKLPVEKSDTYMMDYHQADAKANEIINAKIEFDKKYKVSYLNEQLNVDNSTLKYKINDLNGQAVNNANITVVITRPNNHKHDQELANPNISDGLYTFSNIKLPAEGRWDIMAKINVDDNQRFYNIKVDTRNNKITEY